MRLWATDTEIDGHARQIKKESQSYSFIKKSYVCIMNSIAFKGIKETFYTNDTKTTTYAYKIIIRTSYHLRNIDSKYKSKRKKRKDLVIPTLG